MNITSFGGKMDTFNFWRKWLFGATIIMVVFGVALALLNGTFIFSWMNDGINPPFWSDSSSITPAIRNYQQFTTGLLGTLMTCWGLTVMFIAQYSFRRQESWAWTGLVFSVGLWFLMDTSISLYYRVYFNALSNLGFLVLLALPLFFTRKHFAPLNIKNEL
jgi:hypothetical protein